MKCYSHTADYFEITFNLSNNFPKGRIVIKKFQQKSNHISDTFIRTIVTVNLKIYVSNLC